MKSAAVSSDSKSLDFKFGGHFYFCVIGQGITMFLDMEVGVFLVLLTDYKKGSSRKAAEDMLVQLLEQGPNWVTRARSPASITDCN